MDTDTIDIDTMSDAEQKARLTTLLEQDAERRRLDKLGVSMTGAKGVSKAGNDYHLLIVKGASNRGSQISLTPKSWEVLKSIIDTIDARMVEEFGPHAS